MPRQGPVWSKFENTGGGVISQQDGAERERRCTCRTAGASHGPVACYYCAATRRVNTNSRRWVGEAVGGLWPTFVAVKIRRNDTVMLITFMRFRSIPSVVSRAAAAVDRDCPAPSSAWETPGFEREREM